MRFVVADPLFPTKGAWMPVTVGRTYRFTVDADVPQQNLIVELDGQPVLSNMMSSGEMNVVAHSRSTYPNNAALPLTVSIGHTAVPPLCTSLLQAKKPS